MIGIAAIWIGALLLLGGFALDRVLTKSLVDNFDEQMVFLLNSMIASSEIDPVGEVRFNRPPADQRFLEPYSGMYFQISGAGADAYPSRSLWDRRLRVGDNHGDVKPHLYDSGEFSTAGNPEPLRIVERDVVLPGSEVRWRFQLAQTREALDEQISRLRSTLSWSFAALGFGLLILAALQTVYGLWPLRRVRREVASIRSGEKTRIGQDFPTEIRPLTEEINQLLAHSEEQAEEARRHAGNLAHALKTPLTVITNAATADDPDLNDIVCREATVMRRQVDHHLARARAIGRRASAQARARVWESLEAVQREVERMHEGVTIDIAGNLAHALKTPLTVITNAATADDPGLNDIVCREATVMRRQVDHHLARARAIGRRASAQARARVWDSLEAVQRAVERMHEGVTIDIAGDRFAEVRVERQDLDEMLGNLIENAAKYGGGRVFVTVAPGNNQVDILVEDDGPGIPAREHDNLFSRGARLDTTGKPGTGLGLAIVRDVAQIYGGSVTLEESADLGGLLARLSLPSGAAAAAS